MSGTRKLVWMALLAGTPVILFGQAGPPLSLDATYVGSKTCGACHAAIYERWSKTRMANVVTDPKAHPEVILPDLSKPDPVLTFKKEDIALVYGTKWKQRYFQKVGDDYFPLGAQWDVTHKIWRPYNAAVVTEWNVGCERCHGPGSEHARSPSQANIVNPARLSYVQATNVCIQCHSQGQ